MTNETITTDTQNTFYQTVNELRYERVLLDNKETVS